MKFNKLVVIILILTSLLLSAIGTTYYFYSKHQKVLTSNNELKTIFVAAKDIKKNTIVTIADIKEVKVAKKYILSKPLLKKEILNKVAKENIYQNDMFRKEKLSKKIDIGESDIMKFQNNSYNIGFKLFSNPNYSLNQGDFINIVSVYPKSKRKDNMDYKVQYIAKNIKVIGFLEKGKSVKKCFRFVKKEVKNKNKNNKTVRYENVKVFADELVLDIPSETILDLLEDYNKGMQVWMVKTIEAKEVKKEELPVVQKFNVKITKTKKEKVYKVQWYVPKNRYESLKATVQYADINKIETSDKITVKKDNTLRCQDKTKLLIGISKNVILRKSMSIKSKAIGKIHRNYLIPYTRKVNQNWYEVCDGSYVHRNEARVISPAKAKEKLSWQQKK